MSDGKPILAPHLALEALLSVAIAKVRGADNLTAAAVQPDLTHEECAAHMKREAAKYAQGLPSAAPPLKRANTVQGVEFADAAALGLAADDGDGGGAAADGAPASDAAVE